MADVPWLVRTAPDQVIITAPGAPAGVDTAIEQLRAALDGFAGRKPAWFRRLERLGYWWYPICMAATAALFAFIAPNGLALNLAYGLGFGVLAAVVSGGIASMLAHLQARMTSGRTVKETIEAAAPLARHGGGVADRAEAILAWDPSREREVHLLAWRAAEVGAPDRSGADRELDALWKRADPATAAEREAQLRKIEEDIADLRRKGKI